MKNANNEIEIATEKHFLGPNRKVVADRAGTNVRK
jgi:hypothetical protein